MARIREPQQVEIGVHDGSVAVAAMAEKVAVTIWIRRVAVVVASFVPETHVVAKLMRERLRRRNAEAETLGGRVGRVVDNPCEAAAGGSPQQDQVGSIDVTKLVNFIEVSIALCPKVVEGIADATQVVVHLRCGNQSDPLAHVAVAIGLVRFLHQQFHQRANALVAASGTPAARRVDDKQVNFAAVVRRTIVLAAGLCSALRLGGLTVKYAQLLDLASRSGQAIQRLHVMPRTCRADRVQLHAAPDVADHRAPVDDDVHRAERIVGHATRQGIASTRIARGSQDHRQREIGQVDGQLDAALFHERVTGLAQLRKVDLHRMAAISWPGSRGSG